MDREEYNHTIILNNKISETINESTYTKNYKSFYNKLNEVIIEIDAFFFKSRR